MTSEYVLSWLDPAREDEQGIDGKYYWQSDLYQTQRSCAEALLAKPIDGRTYYVNGTAVSRATAQGSINFYSAKDAEHERWRAEQREIAAAEEVRNERRRQAQLAVVTGILQAHEHRPSDQKLEASALAAFVIGAYEAAGKEV